MLLFSFSVITPSESHQSGGCYDAPVGEERHGTACRTAGAARPCAGQGKLCQKLSKKTCTPNNLKWKIKFIESKFDYFKWQLKCRNRLKIYSPHRNQPKMLQPTPNLQDLKLGEFTLKLQWYNALIPSVTRCLNANPKSPVSHILAFSNNSS